jgi:hypothetical protein
MTVQVVHVKRRGVSAKRVIDLTKATLKPLSKMPPVEPKPEPKPEPKQQQPECLYITAAPDGPPLAADLPEKLRKNELGFVRKTLTDRQIEILDRIVQKAGDGQAKTLGLRLVLAACEDELAAAWPIGLLSKALHISGRPIEGQAVHSVAHGCRVARYGDMARLSLRCSMRKARADVICETEKKQR